MEYQASIFGEKLFFFFERGEKFVVGHHLGKSTVISLDLQQGEGKRRSWPTILQYCMRCSVLDSSKIDQ
jgi:hypothetical protein